MESDKDFQREKNDFFNMRMYVRIAVQRQVTRDSHAYTVFPYGSVASIRDVESSQLLGRHSETTNTVSQNVYHIDLALRFNWYIHWQIVPAAMV